MLRSLVVVIALAAAGCGHHCFSPKSPPSSYAGVAQGLEKGCTCSDTSGATTCVSTVDGTSAVSLTCLSGHWVVAGFCTRGLVAEPGDEACEEAE